MGYHHCKRLLTTLLAYVAASVVLACGTIEVRNYSMTPKSLVDNFLLPLEQNNGPLPPQAAWLTSNVGYQTMAIFLPESSADDVFLQDLPQGYQLLYQVNNAAQQPMIARRMARYLAGSWADIYRQDQLINEQLLVQAGQQAPSSLEAAGMWHASSYVQGNNMRVYYQVQGDDGQGPLLVSRRWQDTYYKPNEFTGLNTIAQTQFPSADNSKLGVAMPQVIAIDNVWYMLYSDSSVPAPAGQEGQVAHYVLRSSQSNFNPNVTSRWSANGFVPVLSASVPEPVWFGKPSSWLYSDVLQRFVVLRTFEQGRLELHLLTLETLATEQNYLLPITALARQVPKLIGGGNGHLSNRGMCERFAVDIMLGTLKQGGVPTTQIVQMDIPYAKEVACPLSMVLNALKGELVIAPERMAGLLYPEGLTTIESIGLQERIRSRAIMLPALLYDSLPRDGHIEASRDAIAIQDKPGVFVAVKPGTTTAVGHWPISCSQAVSDNGSKITLVDDGVYYDVNAPLRYDLYCLEFENF